ncbi:MAG: hypothetical protein ABL921_19000 [Pirellula sp.]
MNWKRKQTLVVAFSAAMALTIGGLSRIGRYDRSPTTLVPAVLEPAKVPVELVTSHLMSAEERIAEATQNHFGPVKAVLDRGRSQTPEFAAKALGWGSKWRIIADAVPFTKGDRNQVFLREQFEEMVLSGPQLQKAVEQCVSEYIAEVRSIENRMLVELRADIQGLSHQYDIGALREDELQAQFDQAIEKAMRLANSDLQSNISSQLVSIIVGEVLTQVAVRLGVSAGILGTGAASGWATLGVGVVVGIVIDQIVMSIWSRWSDPKGQLVDTLTHQLNVVQDMICLGDDQSKGLIKHFQEIAASRAPLRKSVVFEMLGIHDPKNQPEMTETTEVKKEN